MIDITRSFNGDLPPQVLTHSDEPFRFSGTEVIRLAWRHQLRPTGTRYDWALPDLSLLDTVRLAGLGVEMPPEEFAHLVDRSAPADTVDADAIAAAATVALRDPAKIRWIATNTDTVAKSPNWHQVAQGLGGLTVSVPLAEEALFNLMKARAKLPKPLAASVQLNIWFSRRFAARFRRRLGGKRIRVRERGATTRAWSHARTSLGLRVPFEWSSRHGRGAGRPLDDWSTELLADYVDVIENVYPDGSPAVIASLYAIAAGAIGHRASTATVASRWDSLPLTVENKARAMLGLDPADVTETEKQRLHTLTEVAATTSRTAG